jgi:predicted kinase
VSATLIVVSGLPGVGKSATAALVAKRLRAVHLSIDPVEEALLGAGLEPGWATGVAAYEAVRASAETNLLNGCTVVVDAVNDSEPARDTWRRAAASAAADLRWVVLTCSDAGEHQRRLTRRDRGFRFVPEPAWDDIRERREDLSPWVDTRLEVDTSQKSMSDVLTEVLAALALDDGQLPAD